MGDNVMQSESNSADYAAATNTHVPLISWLDPESAAAVRDIVQSVVAHHPEVQAVILFGSVARHEERSLDDAEPSDVDLLLIIDPAVLNPIAEDLTNEQDLALTHTLGIAEYRHRAPRAINTFLMHRSLAHWDELFIENVAHDGMLLWASEPLPAPLAALAERSPEIPLSASAR